MGQGISKTSTYFEWNKSFFVNYVLANILITECPVTNSDFVIVFLKSHQFQHIRQISEKKKLRFCYSNFVIHVLSMLYLGTSILVIAESELIRLEQSLSLSLPLSLPTYKFDTLLSKSSINAR